MPEVKVVIEEVNDPEWAAKLKAQDEKFRRNLAVFDAHAQELFTHHRGKVIVVAGEELHITDTAEEAWAWAKATHPDDEGVFVHYIPRERGWRIYANHQRDVLDNFAVIVDRPANAVLLLAPRHRYRVEVV